MSGHQNGGRGAPRSGDDGRRVLFTSSSRRGLGHLVRGLNIARAVRARDDRLEIGLITRGQPPAGMIDRGVVSTVRCVPTDDWPQEIDAFGPSLTVWDTLLPQRPITSSSKRKNVFVMRRCREDRRQALLHSPVLRAFDRILIPHERTEFGDDLPGDLSARARYVGPILRRPLKERQAALRKRYGLSAGDFVLVSTLGGGGFPEHAQDFLEAVDLAHRTLAKRLHRLRHLVVAGPRYRGAPISGPGLRFVESEPDLVSLLGLADCVIAAGGYNTINEIRANGVPAVLLPGKRTHDDQAERAASLARAGLAVVATGTVLLCSRTIVDTCSDGGLLAAMRERQRQMPIADGSDAAADEILRLIPC